ncbi:MAG: ATP-dependent helicase [Patescibacteria group bacterium]|nr:ATP-dependent helicase [Patescibacteria group bacterium]
MSRLDYENELNAEQLAVVREGDGPCLVLAGAGSGKTRTIVYRVAWLIEHGIAPENILLLTFTNKAANEMMTRIGELLGAAGSRRPLGLWGGTFHSVANRLLRVYADRVGCTPSFTILDQDDSRSLYKASIKELGHDKAGRRFPSPAVVQDVVSYRRNAQMSFEAALMKLHPHFLGIMAELQAVADLYEKKKLAANAMDFDDLLVRLARLLEDDPLVRERLSSQFKYILVDEYQDTNALQNALIRRLAGPKHNLLVVGDDAQSIYSFRAADVRNILDFPKHYPEARVFKLETNYRSTPEILGLANDIIAKNVEQFPKELAAVRGGQEKPAIVPSPSASREAEFVANSIEKLLRTGTRPVDIAVLFRAASHSQALEFELTRRGIPYDYRGGLRFFDRAHVKDTLAFLRVRQNFADEAAWRRVLENHWTGIGEVAAGRLLMTFRQGGSLERIPLLDGESIVGNRGAVGWRDLHATLEEVVAAGDVPAALIRSVIKSPYADFLEAEFPNFRERLEDLEQMARFAEPYVKLDDFLAEVTLDEARATGGHVKGANQVVLSTVHQAKGLEWPIVFVIHLTASSFPNRRALEEQGGVEEERRLFYVAVTRAKDRLYLSHPASVGRGSIEFEERSMFLDEISPNCVSDPTGRKCGFSEFSGDDDYDDEAVEIGADGEPTSAMQGVKNRMQQVKKDWKKKSFLGDY